MLGRVLRRFFSPVDRSSSPITLRVGVRPRNTKLNWIFLLLPTTRLLQNIIYKWYKWYKWYFVDASLSLCTYLSLSVSLFLSLSLQISLSISFSFSHLLTHCRAIYTVAPPRTSSTCSHRRIDWQTRYCGGFGMFNAPIDCYDLWVYPAQQVIYE